MDWSSFDYPVFGRSIWLVCQNQLLKQNRVCQNAKIDTKTTSSFDSTWLTLEFWHTWFCFDSRFWHTRFGSEIHENQNTMRSNPTWLLWYRFYSFGTHDSALTVNSGTPDLMNWNWPKTTEWNEFQPVFALRFQLGGILGGGSSLSKRKFKQVFWRVFAPQAPRFWALLT